MLSKQLDKHNLYQKSALRCITDLQAIEIISVFNNDLYKKQPWGS